MSEATPRPWRQWATDGDHGLEITIEGEGHAVTYLPDQSDLSEANAALIVRAVNAHDALVEALEAALATLEEWQADDGQGDDAAILNARAALALARGQK